MPAERVLLLGAAGRDFHNFNTCFRDNPRYQVVAFTAAQIPGIADRRYPAELAGAGYPAGIPIYPEAELTTLIARLGVEIVVFSYSDVAHRQVMHLAAEATAAGAEFRLLSAASTMLSARVPVVAVCAVRTGCGKSQTARYVVERLRRRGYHPVVLRHPMPYGELSAQRAVQRFASYDDLNHHACTIEEREEYEPHLERQTVVFAGIDYAAIVEQAQQEGDCLVWDGGNNDTPFVRPELWITLADPLRAGHELDSHPGEVNLRAADIVVIGKISVASAAEIETVAANVARVNARAVVVRADSALTLDPPRPTLAGQRVLVVEDGPTLTHGSMPFGAATVAAARFGAAQKVDPRPTAVGSLRDVYGAYPHLGLVLPAMGYSAEQVAALAATINAAEADLVLSATPIDLARLAPLNKPVVQVRYELIDAGPPTLASCLERSFPGPPAPPARERSA